jgi:competence protein ComEC
MASHFYLRPIAVLLISLMGGIILGCHFPGYPIGTLGIVFFGAGYIGINLVRKKSVGLSPIILYVALGYIAIQPWVAPRFSAIHIQNFSEDTRWQIAGVVDSHPLEFSYLKKFVLRTEILKHKETSYRVSGKIRVTVSGPGPVFARGDRVVFRSRLRQPRNFNNPGGFDYRRYMAFKGLWRTAYTKGSRLQVVQRASSGDLAQQLHDARQALAALIDRTGKGSSVAVLKALVIGDRTAISSEVRDKFNRAGVGHVLAISGLHIGIVATVAFFFFHKLLLLAQPLLWRAWTRKGAAILSLVPVCIYGLVSGMSPSTQRAVIMVGAFLMTFLFERERDTLNTLALAAFLILIWFPPALFSISFQLSFMAVLSILYGLACIQKATPIDGQNVKSGFVKSDFKTSDQVQGQGAGRSRKRSIHRYVSIYRRLATQPLGLRWGFEITFNQLYRKLVTFFLVSLLAICGTLPLVMFYFNQISLVGLLANFVVVPLVGFVVIPFGLLTLFIYPVSSQIASGCVQICLYVLDYVLMAINYFADLPFAAVKTITPSLFEMVCYYVLGWVMLNGLNTRQARVDYRNISNHRVGRVSARNRNLKPYSRFGLNNLFSMIAAVPRWLPANPAAKRSTIIGLVVVLALLVDAGYWFARRHFNSDLRVTYIDVGQGSSTLLELPGGHTALIDGGGFSDNNTFDMGARVLAPFLWRKKIRTIDTLVLSHPNSDHLNGLIFIARHFNVKAIWTNNETRTTQGYKRLQHIIAQKQINRPDFQHMPRQQLINGIEFCLLYPPADFLARKASQKWRSPNNNSLVVKVTFGDISFLFAGDIMAKAEQELVDLAGTDLGCDVLLVPHHGSRTSSSQPFLSSVQPDVAVFSAGWKNRFRLPHPNVLAAYNKIGCRIFRTDQNGAIMIETDGNRLTVKPFISSDNPP